MNHFTNQLCHSSINPQSRQKELTLVICQVIWLWQHTIWFCWPSPHPTPGNANLQVTKKVCYHLALLWGERGGRKFEFFSFETYVLHWNFCLKFFNETFNVLCKNTPLRLLRGFVVSLEQKESQSHHSKLDCFFLSNTKSWFLKLP